MPKLVFDLENVRKGDLRALPEGYYEAEIIKAEVGVGDSGKVVGIPYIQWLFEIQHPKYGTVEIQDRLYDIIASKAYQLVTDVGGLTQKELEENDHKIEINTDDYIGARLIIEIVERNGYKNVQSYHGLARTDLLNDDPFEGAF